MTGLTLNSSIRNVYFQRFAYICIVVTSILIALLSYRFAFIGFEEAFAMDGVIADLLANERNLFIAHVIASPIALLLGGIQFHEGLRKRYPSYHRGIGLIYVIAIFIGGHSAFLLGVVSYEDRPISSMGYMLLAFFWITFATLGLKAALLKDFAQHRQWMIYAFALTFAGVTFRLHLGVGFMLGYDYETIANIVAWSCWIPNLIFAWLYLGREQLNSVFQIHTFSHLKRGVK